MRRTFPLSLLTLTVSLMACGNAASDVDSTAKGNPQSATANEMENPNSEAEEAPAAGQLPAQTPPPTTSQYRLLGILDPDFGNMVAFALKVPRGWQTKQSFRREWDGAVPHAKVAISFRSPDKTQQIDYLPLVEYQYGDGPLTQQVRMQRQQMGLPAQTMPNELAPMPALAYLKRYLLPQLAQNGLQLRNVGNERETAPHPSKQNAQRMESSASVDGMLANGHHVRVEARMGLSKQQMGSDIYYGWSVVPSITQTSGDNLAATYAHTKTAQESIVSNPAWVQKNNEVTNRGQQANSEASRRQHEATMAGIAAQTAANTAAHNQRMNNIAAAGAASTARYNDRMNAMDQNMASWQAQQASGDRQHEAYVDNVIRNETKFENPSTGERVKLDNRYDHAYTNNKGVYYQSNTPIEPGNVNWQELGKVSMSDY